MFFLKSLQQSRNVGIVISILQRKWEAPWITWPISRSWKVGNLAPVRWLQGRWLSQPEQSMLCPSREEDWEHERQPWGFWREVSESDGETTNGLRCQSRKLGLGCCLPLTSQNGSPRVTKPNSNLRFFPLGGKGKQRSRARGKEGKVPLAGGHAYLSGHFWLAAHRTYDSYGMEVGRPRG